MLEPHSIAAVAIAAAACHPTDEPEVAEDTSELHWSKNVELGPRPYYLVDNMDDGPLKRRLERPVRKSDFSIGHRGAPLQFPEHTKASYEAAARMGAGR